MHRKRAFLSLCVGMFLGMGFVLARFAFGGAEEERQLNPQDGRFASVAVDCSAEAKPISPLIYGIGGSDKPWAVNPAAIRWGGNPTSRYNWEFDTSNSANDWFFKNGGGANPGKGHEDFIARNAEHGIKGTITLSMLGWVAKDNTSYGFPVSEFGPQMSTAPELPNAGNGVGRDGKPIPPGPPSRTSVASTPETIAQWVKKIRAADLSHGVRTMDAYILDNEPMLWNATHRDVHPEPATYDELLEKTIAYGTAVRKADPETKIAGPAEWGWLSYHYSAKDTAAGVFQRPDRRQHGDQPLIPWYLSKLREHEKKTGVKILDLVDVHFYPMGDGVRSSAPAIDPATAARRIRATRSLWDPTYRDESWINERMRVLPLLRQWIAENYPGLGISIGEWDFGAETHMSGGLAMAEVLGRFGLEGVSSAYHWGNPEEGSPGFWAFRAFRNFDGKGARFQDWSVPVKIDGTLVSLFASRDERRNRLVSVLLNFAPLSRLTTRISLQGCGSIALANAYAYDGRPAGFTDLKIGFTKDTLDIVAAPYSITVLDLGTAPTPKP